MKTKLYFIRKEISTQVFNHLKLVLQRFIVSCMQVSHTHTHTLAMQQRHRGPRLKTPQGLHAAALLQVQQLDQDDRVDVQKAAVAGTDSTSDGAASNAAM